MDAHHSLIATNDGISVMHIQAVVQHVPPAFQSCMNVSRLQAAQRLIILCKQSWQVVKQTCVAFSPCYSFDTVQDIYQNMTILL